MFRGCRRSVVVAGALLLASWLLWPGRAAGWGPGGHRVVANIAYDRLDPATRSSIVKVLRKHKDFENRFTARMPDDIRTGPAEDQERWIFLQAAIWPDLIRPIREYHKENWHFINMPYYLSPHDQAALQDVIKPNVSLALPSPLPATAELEKLNGVQALKLCVRGLTDADTTDEEKAIYFCWLLHIVGDIHQPLHSTCLVSRGRFHTFEGDRGGNGIHIKQGKNLHSFWDGMLGGEQTMNSIRKRAADILASDELKKAAEDAVGKKKLAVEVWVQESNELAKDKVYDKLIIDEVTKGEANATHPLGKVDLPLEYRQMAGQLAQRRVAEAGYRLAEILKQVAD
jgi:hypothetical protein